MSSTHVAKALKPPRINVKQIYNTGMSRKRSFNLEGIEYQACVANNSDYFLPLKHFPPYQ